MSNAWIEVLLPAVADRRGRLRSDASSVPPPPKKNPIDLVLPKYITRSAEGDDDELDAWVGLARTSPDSAGVVSQTINNSEDSLYRP